MDYPEEALVQLFPHYSQDLEAFVKDEQVAEELLKPLTETTTKYQLNAEFLAQRWQEMALQALPTACWTGAFAIAPAVQRRTAAPQQEL